MKNKLLFLIASIYFFLLSTNLVFANNPKAKFHDSIKNTSEVLKEDINLIGKELYLDTVLKTINSDFKIDFNNNVKDFNFNEYEYVPIGELDEEEYEFHSTPATITDLFYNTQMFSHSKNNSKLIKTHYKFPSLRYPSRHLNENKFDIFKSDEFISTKFYDEPNLSYFIDTEVINKYWEDYVSSNFETPDNQTIGILSNAINSEFLNIDKIISLNDEIRNNTYISKINIIINKYFEKGTYSFAGEEIINTYHGDIPTEKYSFILSSKHFKELILELSNIYLMEHYANYNFSYANYYSSLIDELSLGNLTYSVNISKDNLILRNEFRFAFSNPYEGKLNVTLLIDTTGENNLLDEIKVSLNTVDFEKKVSGYSFNLKGNVVPNNGKIDASYNIDYITTENETNRPENTTYIKGNFFKDRNTYKDNFLFTCGFLNDYFSYSTYFDVKGILTENSKKDKVSLVVNDGNYFDSYKSFSFNTDLSVENLNTLDYTIDEGSIDFSSLTEDEVFEIMYMMYSFF